MDTIEADVVDRRAGSIVAGNELFMRRYAGREKRPGVLSRVGLHEGYDGVYAP